MFASVSRCSQALRLQLAIATTVALEPSLGFKGAITFMTGSSELALASSLPACSLERSHELQGPDAEGSVLKVGVCSGTKSDFL